MREEHEDEPEGLDKPPSFFPYDPADGERQRADFGEPVEVSVEGVFAAETNGSIQRFVLLGDGERKVPILIGPFEAQAISLPLEGAQPDRPMTHDLLRTIIERLGATLDRVVIDDLWSTTYYAKLHLQRGKETMEIDVRPSDAIALAVRFEAPIFVSEGILDQAMEN
jgi:bifunctional DNase/RNase